MSFGNILIKPAISGVGVRWVWFEIFSLFLVQIGKKPTALDLNLNWTFLLMIPLVENSEGRAVLHLHEINGLFEWKERV